ncbi:unnamed protein product [Toxocara canis]|uniref:Secreted protein n=1 Tax=Toxocara canis TaxID=6265 RepID=A0A183TYJ0_TOXCA|nr:unnamed protein product [Toxocara canis]
MRATASRRTRVPHAAVCLLLVDAPFPSRYVHNFTYARATISPTTALAFRSFVVNTNKPPIHIQCANHSLEALIAITVLSLNQPLLEQCVRLVRAAFAYRL